MVMNNMIMKLMVISMMSELMMMNIRAMIDIVLLMSSQIHVTMTMTMIKAMIMMMLVMIVFVTMKIGMIIINDFAGNHLPHLLPHLAPLGGALSSSLIVVK